MFFVLNVIRQIKRQMKAVPIIVVRNNLQWQEFCLVADLLHLLCVKWQKDYSGNSIYPQREAKHDSLFWEPFYHEDTFVLGAASESLPFIELCLD